MRYGRARTEASITDGRIYQPRRHWFWQCLFLLFLILHIWSHSCHCQKNSNCNYTKFERVIDLSPSNFCINLPLNEFCSYVMSLMFALQVDSITPTQSWDMIEDELGELEYETRITKFQGLRCITLFFSANFGGETTKIFYIGLTGESKKVYKRIILGF